jgi:hypothetical protein
MKNLANILMKLILILIVLFLYAQFLSIVSNNIQSINNITLYLVYFIRIFAYLIIGFIFAFNDYRKFDSQYIFVLVFLLIGISLFLYQNIYLKNYDLINDFVKVASIILGAKLYGLVKNIERK